MSGLVVVACATPINLGVSLLIMILLTSLAITGWQWFKRHSIIGEVNDVGAETIKLVGLVVIYSSDFRICQKTLSFIAKWLIMERILGWVDFAECGDDRTGVRPS